MSRNPKDRDDQLKLLNSLSSTPIRDSQGKPVGRVTDFIVDLSEARLAYLSIELQSLNGGNDTVHVCVPWSVVSVDPGENGGLRVAVRRDTLMRIAKAVSGR